MTDEEQEYVARHGPMPSTSWLAEHARRMRDEADAAEASRDSATTAALIGSVREIAERQVEAFAALPCGGALDRIGACSEAFAMTCERRMSPSCPREIRAFDASRRRQELRTRLRELDVESEHIDAILARDPDDDALTWVPRLLSSAVPIDGVLCQLSGFRVTKGTAAVDRFLSTPGMRTLVLAGGVGCGKSVAASYAVRRHAGRFMTWAHIDEWANFDVKTHTVRKAAAYAVPLLVIDDLGLERLDGRGAFLSHVQQLLDERHDQRRRTVITTNLEMAAFGRRYQARVADRIAGSGMFVPLVGPSLRTRTA